MPFQDVYRLLRRRRSSWRGCSRMTRKTPPSEGPGLPPQVVMCIYDLVLLWCVSLLSVVLTDQWFGFRAHQAQSFTRLDPVTAGEGDSTNFAIKIRRMVIAEIVPYLDLVASIAVVAIPTEHGSEHTITRDNLVLIPCFRRDVSGTLGPTGPVLISRML